jgi:hypothetical protein
MVDGRKEEGPNEFGIFAHFCAGMIFDNLIERQGRLPGAKVRDGNMPSLPGQVWVILRGKKIKYAAIRELLGGNTRQGIGPSSAYCRVLPGIAA